MDGTVLAHLLVASLSTERPHSDTGKPLGGVPFSNQGTPSWWPVSSLRDHTVTLASLLVAFYCETKGHPQGTPEAVTQDCLC